MFYLNIYETCLLINFNLIPIAASKIFNIIGRKCPTLLIGYWLNNNVWNRKHMINSPIFPCKINQHRGVKETEKSGEAGQKLVMLTSWQFDPTTGPKGLGQKVFSSPCTPVFFSDPTLAAFLSLFSGRFSTLDLIHSPWRAFRYAFPALISCLAPGLNLSRIFWSNKTKAYVMNRAQQYWRKVVTI